MTKVLLSVHVLAAILFIGPVTVATSLFPRAARAAITARADGGDRGAERGVLHWLHRVSRVYAVLGLAVPAFGLATGARMGVLDEAWLVVAIALTAVAVALLFLAVLPAQDRLVALAAPAGPAPDPGAVARLTARAASSAGVFALLWAVVTVLMIVRPGSTTGA